jgi:phosphonate transport system substrate-binding protein
MSRLPRRQLLVAASLALLSGAVRAQEPAAPGRPLVFGLITPRAAEQTRANWMPFVSRMAADLKRPVELRLFAESRDLVQAMRSAEVDLAWLGNAAALDVVESGTGSVFAQMVAKDGSVGYRSVLVVPRDSPVGSLSEVIQKSKTLRFGDGEPKSTSGHMVPSYFAFQKNGVNDVKAVFKSVSNASHQKNLTMVARGEVDVATANNEELAFFARDVPQLSGQVRVIWESPLIAQSPLVWHSALPKSLRARILKFVVGFGSNAEERDILMRLNGLSAFRQSSNRQLVPTADLEMFKARQAINNDASLSPQERAHRIDEVIRRGSKLDLLLKLSASTW